ncbi:MAG TPA: hypothetical protein PK449_08470, partial [Exilispira sp.]|nr:hypothetical protein [Exilispira sp.]
MKITISQKLSYNFTKINYEKILMRVPFKIGIYLVKKFILPFIVISVLVVFLYIVQDFILNVNKYMKMDLNSLFKYYLY